MLLRRPDVLAAEQKLIAANANIGAARAAFLPRISPDRRLWHGSSALSGLFDAGSGAWSFQPVLRLPLFDAGRSSAGSIWPRRARIIAVAEYEKTIQQAFREVADLLAARTYLAEQLRAQQAAEKCPERTPAPGGSPLQGRHLQLPRSAGRAARILCRAASQRADTARLAGDAAQLYKALGGG